MLTQNHNYETFYEVLKILNPKKNNLNLILTFAGRIDKKIIKIYSNKIELLNKGYIDHNNAISTIKSSHLLINFNYKNIIQGIKLIIFDFDGNSDYRANKNK